MSTDRREKYTYEEGHDLMRLRHGGNESLAGYESHAFRERAELIRQTSRPSKPEALGRQIGSDLRGLAAPEEGRR